MSKSRVMGPKLIKRNGTTYILEDGDSLEFEDGWFTYTKERPVLLQSVLLEQPTENNKDAKE
jgi:hypothetical protein